MTPAVAKSVWGTGSALGDRELWRGQMVDRALCELSVWSRVFH